MYIILVIACSFYLVLIVIDTHMHMHTHMSFVYLLACFIENLLWGIHGVSYSDLESPAMGYNVIPGL